jgi:hypothetical protein
MGQKEDDRRTSLAASEGPPSNVSWTTIRLGKLRVAVEEIGIVQARTDITGLIRASSTSGRAFRIRNEKNPDAATALLVSPETLEKWVIHANRPRKLGAVLASLPFKNTGRTGRVKVRVPDNTMRVLTVPPEPGPAED